MQRCEGQPLCNEVRDNHCATMWGTTTVQRCGGQPLCNDVRDTHSVLHWIPQLPLTTTTPVILKIQVCLKHQIKLHWGTFQLDQHLTTQVMTLTYGRFMRMADRLVYYREIIILDSPHQTERETIHKLKRTTQN